MQKTVVVIVKNEITEHTANLENMKHILALIHVELKYGGLNLNLNDTSMMRATGNG